MLQLIRSRPLSYFANLVKANERSLLRVYIVSPWIASSTSQSFPAFSQVLLSTRAAKARLTVLTRPPDKPQYLAALRLISSNSNSEILYLESLHAKLYLLECNALRVAMWGSPNFTPPGDTYNRELAVVIKSTKETDPAAAFIEDLFLYTRELMSAPEARFSKRLGTPLTL